MSTPAYWVQRALDETEFRKAKATLLRAQMKRREMLVGRKERKLIAAALASDDITRYGA